MTETASAVIGVPPNTEAPVDADTETLAIGVPFPSLEARVVDIVDGSVVTGTDAGELELRGPQITPGYLGKPEANEVAFDDGWLRTGDVAVMDESGWIYLVDRIKDQINASGYKVWPREVEDVLYEHPAVLEAAVVGLPDEYRGETVAAYVSLRAGRQLPRQNSSNSPRNGLPHTSIRAPSTLWMTFRRPLPARSSGDCFVSRPTKRRRLTNSFRQQHDTVLSTALQENQ